MKHKHRELLAHIGWEDERVTIEVIRLSRNGCSYHFDNQIWHRNLSGLGDDKCRNASGTRLKISPLSRRRLPSWVKDVEITVATNAKKRYELWLKKSLSN